MRRAIESISMLFVMTTLLLPIHAKADDDFNHSPHAVFIMSNSADQNEVIAFAQAAEGTLTESGRFPTGGRGSGGNNDPLESQGSLTLSQDRSLLFAVSAGSGEISVFRVHGSALVLSDKVRSEGSEPNAIAQHGSLVYVLNTGGSSNVAGFVLEGDHLHYINNSLSFLSTNTSGAASIAFSPDGTLLAVTERLTNDIDVFKVQADGTLSPIVINPSSGPGAPFSVSFAPSEGCPRFRDRAGKRLERVSHFFVCDSSKSGMLSAISTSVPTLGGANCWNVVTPDGPRFVLCLECRILDHLGVCDFCFNWSTFRTSRDGSR